MRWTKAQLGTIPEVYRDFMAALGPVVYSFGSALETTAVPLSRVYTSLRLRHRYEPEQVMEIAENLKRKGLVLVDRNGFVEPTLKGISLIRKLIGIEEPAVTVAVPPLPDI